MSNLVGALREIAGEQLRIIALLEPYDYDLLYVREDLADSYDSDELEEAYRSVMGSQVAIDDFATSVELGRFDAQVSFFESVVVAQFPSDRYEGVFASFDRTDSLPVVQIADAADDIGVHNDDAES